MKHKSWAIVLAGGEGTRMKRFVTSQFGTARPKQYCVFTGTRSMLQHGLDRISRVVDSDRIVTVIGKGHWRYLLESSVGRLPGRIIEQPDSRGTAGALFSALSCILAIDPDAIVLVTPSDHFVYPETDFVDQLGLMLRAANEFPDRLVLLGAKGESPGTDYGWIEPGPRVKPGLHRVLGFREKPSAPEAKSFLDRGFLLNTMLLASKASALWCVGKALLPAFTERFGAVVDTLRAAYRGNTAYKAPAHGIAWPQVYADIASADLSRDMLQGAAGQALVLQMDPKLRWSDWGRPERVLESLLQLRKRETESKPEATLA